MDEAADWNVRLQGMRAAPAHVDLHVDAQRSRGLLRNVPNVDGRVRLRDMYAIGLASGLFTPTVVYHCILRGQIVGTFSAASEDSINIHVVSGVGTIHAVPAVVQAPVIPLGGARKSRVARQTVPRRSRAGSQRSRRSRRTRRKPRA